MVEIVTSDTLCSVVRYLGKTVSTEFFFCFFFIAQIKSYILILLFFWLQDEYIKDIDLYKDIYIDVFLYTIWYRDNCVGIYRCI